jgi:hypothetical protein
MRTPLTKEEHERLRELLRYPSPVHLPVDARLIELGLASQRWEDHVLKTVADQEHVGPDGCEPYYERDGNPNPVSYPTVGEEDVLRPGCFFVKLGESEEGE